MMAQPILIKNKFDFDEVNNLLSCAFVKLKESDYILLKNRVFVQTDPSTKKGIDKYNKLINTKEVKDGFYSFIILRIKCESCRYEREYFLKAYTTKGLAVFGLTNIITQKNNLNNFMLKLENSSLLQKMKRNFIFHAERKIRFSGDKKHMDLIIKLFGDSYALSNFKDWHNNAKKVVKNLSSKIEEMGGLA